VNRRPGRLLSARDAEKVLGIPASTVRNWLARSSRTGLQVAGTDRRGKQVFRESDLIALRDRRRRLLHPVRNTTKSELGRHLSALDATGLFPGGTDNNEKPWFYEADLIVLARGLRIRDNKGERIHDMSDLA